MGHRADGDDDGVDLAPLFGDPAVPSDSGTTLDASDGRVANRLRNRAKVIDAFVDLINEGKAPTVDEIAERAGVGRRSIFRYFTDLSDLAMEGVRRVATDVSPVIDVADLGHGDLTERIDVMVRFRLMALQGAAPFIRIARYQLAHLDGVGEAVAAIVGLVRAQLETQFAPELSSLPPDVASQLVDAMLALTDFGSYDMLTRHAGKDPDEVAEIWTTAFTMILPG